MTNNNWKRICSNWGCVRAAIIILTTLAIHILPVPGSAMDTGIDLLAALNRTQYTGIEYQINATGARLYVFQKKNRDVILPPDQRRLASAIIQKSIDYTFLFNVLQRNKVGTLLAFTENSQRYLEILSSGNRRHIRFSFQYKTVDGQIKMYTEEFPSNFMDGKWHKVALSLSGPAIQLYIDCELVQTRVTKETFDRSFLNADNTQLWLGQSNNKSGIFVGEMKEARIVPGKFSYRSQCSHLDETCPTCGQYSVLEETINELRGHLKNLTQRLVAAEDRVSRLEQCDCKKSCTINSTDSIRIRNDGEMWTSNCTKCQCEQGIVTCIPKDCKKMNCIRPKPEDESCCAMCPKTCFHDQEDFDDGYTYTKGCLDCSCINGVHKCIPRSKDTCEKLNCPLKEQRTDVDKCCPYCIGYDYCSKGHACHTNATCLNLHTKYTCTCHAGFQGDGFNCTDIDECANEGGYNGNHCNANTKCVNTNGSYICECLPGYERQDKYNCIEIDECATGQHKCHSNTTCSNTKGSYNCQCIDGYYGDGFNCEPICNQTCLNRGRCTSPGTCTCFAGYHGNSCEYDINECDLGKQLCGPRKICVNTIGSYSCLCKPGYYAEQGLCKDIDECHHKSHTCHESAQCINTDGHFECHCPDNDSRCRLSCMFEDVEVADGGSKIPENNPCQICTCDRGVITCKEKLCNCSNYRGKYLDKLCCPDCEPKSPCEHQELKHVVFKHGERWNYQCDLCECLDGETDCWKVECPECDNPLPLLPNECCPRCPEQLCSKNSNITYLGQPCEYNNRLHDSGEHFPVGPCQTCDCKDGKLHCNYVNNCNDNESSPKGSATISFVANNYIDPTSKTKTSTAPQQIHTTGRPISKRSTTIYNHDKIRITSTTKRREQFSAHSATPLPYSNTVVATNNNKIRIARNLGTA